MFINKKSVVVVASALVLSTAVSAERWDVATGFPEGNFQTQNVYYFGEQLEELTGGAITLQVHSGMSLYRQPEIKQAVATGQIPMGEILLSAYGNEDPFFEADSIPFLASGYDEAWELYQVQRPFVEERLERQGVKLLYSVAWPGTGFYTTYPVDDISDLSGERMRAYNSATSRLAEHLGATPTTVEQVEAPQAFSTGVISAMITSPVTGVNTQSWDFIDYFTDLSAWHNKNFVIMNLRTFNSLDEETQQAILTAAERAEKRGWEESRKAAKSAVETLAEHGMQVNEPSEQLMEDFRAIGTLMIEEWLDRAGSDGQALVDAMNSD